MSRLRKLDQRILHPPETEPIDIDDQNQLIHNLYQLNDANHRLYNKVLCYSILIEFPISVYINILLKRKYEIRVSKVIQLIILLSQILTMINILIKSDLFNIINIINGLLIINLWYWFSQIDKNVLVGLMIGIPTFNLIMIVFINKWFNDISSNLMNLKKLRYKYKLV